MAIGDKQRALNQLFEDLKAQCQGYRCVKCKRTPWPAWINGTHTLRCGCGTEFELEPIPNIIKEKEAQLLAKQIQNPENMMERVTQANSAGLFPNNANPQQLELMTRAALAYNLDPLMQELILYQGKPYITIDGRRRLDARAGHHPTIKFRPLSTAEKDMLREYDALNDRDVVVVCELTTEWGNSVEGFGRVLASERNGSPNLPLVSRPIEMAQKRAEARARKMAYGPNPIPQGLEGVTVLDEDATTVEGEGRFLDEVDLPASRDSGSDPGVEGAAATPETQAPVTPPPKPEPANKPKPPKSMVKGTWVNLRSYMEEQGWQWPEFETAVLNATQAEFAAAGGTPQTAYTRWQNWQDQQDGAEVENQVEQLEQEFQEQSA